MQTNVKMAIFEMYFNNEHKQLPAQAYELLVGWGVNILWHNNFLSHNEHI